MNDHEPMKTHIYRRLFSLCVALILVCLAGTSVALMPPHVTGTNIKDGVLEGSKLVVDGYSLGYTDFKTQFSLVHAKTGKAVTSERDVACKMEGDCKRDRPGSCQERCTVTIRLKDVKADERLELKFLDFKATITVKARK